jgi:hypothetical protein
VVPAADGQQQQIVDGIKRLTGSTDPIQTTPDGLTA